MTVTNYFTLKIDSMDDALKFRSIEYKPTRVLMGEMSVPLAGGLSISRGHEYIEVFLIVKVPRDTGVDPEGYGIESDLLSIIDATKNPNGADGDAVAFVDFDGNSHTAYFLHGRMPGQPLTTIMEGVSSRMLYQIVLVMES